MRFPSWPDYSEGPDCGSPRDQMKARKMRLEKSECHFEATRKPQCARIVVFELGYPFLVDSRPRPQPGHRDPT